jgi:hypothetical protein
MVWLPVEPTSLAPNTVSFATDLFHDFEFIKKKVRRLLRASVHPLTRCLRVSQSEDKLKQCDDLVAMLRARAAAEDAYAKSLRKVSSQPKSSSSLAHLPRARTGCCDADCDGGRDSAECD